MIRHLPQHVLAVVLLVGCAAYAWEAVTDPETATAVAVGYIAFLATVVVVLRMLRKR